MSKELVESYIRHIDHYGTDAIEDTVRKDRRLADEEKEAVIAYLNTKTTKTTPRKRKGRKS